MAAEPTTPLPGLAPATPAAAGAGLTLRFVTHSEIGLVRKNNQDSGYASEHLLLVADGMGGAAAGDLASAVAVDTIRRVDAPTPAPQMLHVLARALTTANDRIADLVEADYALDGMGTTVTAGLFDGTELGLAHIGDSRAYLYRDGRLERLTHDHSWVQSLVDDGKIDAAEAAVHPHRSLLLKVLNGQPANDPDLTRLAVRAGDRLLFCSDGLCGLVEDAEIAAELADPDAAATLRRLVAAAHAEGGIDNITIILADVVEGGGSTDPVVLGAAVDRALPAAAGPATGVRADPRTPTDTRPIAPVADGGTVRAGTATAVRTSTPGRVADDESRYNPQAPGRLRLVKPLVGALVAVLVLAVALGSAYAWVRTQYFVGAAGDRVAVYQGLPDAMLAPLSTVHAVEDIAIADLPPFYADRVRAGIEVPSLASAEQTVAELREAARRCTGQGGSGGPTATPGPTPTPRRTPSSAGTSGSPSPGPAVTSSPSPSPSPTAPVGC